MYEVRIATAKDVIGVRDVAIKAWYNTYLSIYAAKTVNELLAAACNESHLLKRFETQLFLVAVEDDEIVGFANFINGAELYLAAHYVRPESQHHGYGQDLLEKGIAHFKGEYDAIYLEVNQQNTEAVKFYEARGFEMLRTYEREMFEDMMQLALLKKSIA